VISLVAVPPKSAHGVYPIALARDAFTQVYSDFATAYAACPSTSAIVLAATTQGGLYPPQGYDYAARWLVRAGHIWWLGLVPRTALELEHPLLDFASGAELEGKLFVLTPRPFSFSYLSESQTQYGNYYTGIPVSVSSALFVASGAA
jgi:hypothetical protein